MRGTSVWFCCANAAAIEGGLELPEDLEILMGIRFRIALKESVDARFQHFSNPTSSDRPALVVKSSQGQASSGGRCGGFEIDSSKTRISG